MFLHRSHYNRNYQYSHPLAGKVYDNKRFVTQCRSFLDSELKLSTAGSQDPSKVDTPKRKNTTQQEFYHNKVRQRKLQSAHQRLSVNNQPHKVSGQQSRQSRQSLANSQRQGGNSVLMSSKQKGGNNGMSSTQWVKKCQLKRKMAINPFVDGYLFPSIELHIINKINSFSERQKNSLNYGFQKIFKSLISTQLMGEFTSNFMLKMEQYIRRIVANDQMYDNPLGVVLEQGWKGFSRKNDLLDVVHQLQSKGDYAQIQQLAKYYCIPGQEDSQRIFEQMMQDIIIEIYENKSCRRDLKYCLLTQQGQLITHISQIFFSTRCLLISPFEQYQAIYQRYQKVLQQHDKQQRMTFQQSIKHNFVHKIVHNQLEHAHINYSSQYKEDQIQRKGYQEKAQLLLQNRSKCRLQKKKEEGERQFMPQELAFNAPEFTRQSVYRNYLSRKYREKKQYREIIKQLQKILDPNHKYTVRSAIDQKTQEQFARLYNLNDKFDLTFNHNPDNSNKLLLNNLLQNCSLFQLKAPPQMDILLNVIKKVYKKTEEIKEVMFWQFKQIFQTAHGVSDKAVIMTFVLTYLPFDEWGQLSKKKMFKLLEASVPFKGRSLEVIQSILWNWLQRSKLVENEVLRKRNIEIWYQPVRVLYLLMLSIIFGTEFKSIEEMLQQMMKYQFY